MDEDALNLDAIFDNFILDGDKLTAIDCEWIFDESMDFIKGQRTIYKNTVHYIASIKTMQKRYKINSP